MLGLRCSARSGLVVVVVVVGVLLAAVAGCGGSSRGSDPAGGVVVSFKGQPLVTRALVAHWVPIEAVLQRNLTPQERPVAGEVPDPPAYKACIAYQISIAPAGVGKPTPDEAKKECEARNTQIHEHILGLLIEYAWTEAEANAHGITITPKELQARWVREKLELFGPETVFQKYLHATGETFADELKIIRFDMQAIDLREKILHEDGIPALRAFYKQYPLELKTKTNCTPGYITPDCKQYKGNQPPEG